MHFRNTVKLHKSYDSVDVHLVFLQCFTQKIVAFRDSDPVKLRNTSQTSAGGQGASSSLVEYNYAEHHRIGRVLLR